MYVNKRQHTFSMYTASNKFKKQLKEFFDNKTNIKINEYENTLVISKSIDLIKTYEFLYDKENLVFLDRKKQKFETFLNNVKNSRKSTIRSLC